ncbi:MAG: hypothetical protein JSV37_05580 [Anaerolineaceae bacterium]|nr:MAG: hypothetical protein JSV37_05580 [Anaerolineaceae bacterium]
MSKKRRRKRDRRPNLPVEAQTSSKTRSTSQPLPGSGDFNPDYTYVLEDLKRIGLLAGSFIALLIILSLFLR